MSKKPRVALFVTCLVDLYRPSVGFAAVRLLERAGCTVTVPPAQTCCGQPAYNSGDRATASALARDIVAAFEDHDYVVVPSGSCGGMIRHHIPELLADDALWSERARKLGAKTFEIVQFLGEVMKVEATGARFDGKVTYHDSCSGLRELKIKAQPRKLLREVAGLELVEMEESEVCCGFGGTFCVKYPEISTKMVANKARHARATQADLVLAGDMGCLLNIAGRLEREGAATGARHVIEILDGRLDHPPIGKAADHPPRPDRTEG